MSDLLDEVIEPASMTQQATAWTHQLLDRHGIVTRQSVAAEGLPGGFTSVYPVLQRLEETGRARRGYFIERLGGAQFALPGAVDRVRSVPEQSIRVLASTDPANPYGAALDWPTIDEGRIGRITGTHVVLADGHLVAYLDKRKLRTFDLDPDLHGGVAWAIGRLGARSRTLRIETIDGEPAGQTGFGRALGDVGFAPALRGLSYRS